MALKEIKNLKLYLKPPKEKEFVFPWDFIDTGITKEFLYKEWERALKGKTTPPCRLGKCKSLFSLQGA